MAERTSFSQLVAHDFLLYSSRPASGLFGLSLHPDCPRTGQDSAFTQASMPRGPGSAFDQANMPSSHTPPLDAMMMIPQCGRGAGEEGEEVQGLHSNPLGIFRPFSYLPFSAPFHYRLCLVSHILVCTPPGIWQAPE